jgi:hypothetical protein
MSGKMIDFETVRTIARDLPEVEEGSMHGTPALKVRGELLACVPGHKTAEPDSLAVRIHPERRHELMSTHPEVYYVTYHYVNNPVVLVRLSRIHPDALRDLLCSAWRFLTAQETANEDPGNGAKAGGAV